MINILLDYYNIDEPWIFGALKEILLPEMKVAVVAFSFRDEYVKNDADWQKLYGKKQGKIYKDMTRALKAYGISRENVSFINYFTDTEETAKEKIKSADVVYFTGGLPDKMLERIKAFGIYETLMAYDGIVMGYSAGALVQMREYHLSPDDDYPEFKYAEGLPYLSGFYLEVHFSGSEEQRTAVNRALSERKKTVYATRFGKGALIVRDGIIKTVGEVEIFS